MGRFVLVVYCYQLSIRLKVFTLHSSRQALYSVCSGTIYKDDIIVAVWCESWRVVHGGVSSVFLAMSSARVLYIHVSIRHRAAP
jgi:hypothetical protein